MQEYRARRPSRVQTIDIRGLRYAVRLWGEPTAPPLILLHGTRDSSASFQFLVDALEQDWFVIAPDWRGHGLTQWSAQGYWLHEYLGDLERLLDLLAAGKPVNLIGHSLGGNIACTYAGLRPERVSHLIALDAVGIPAIAPERMPDILRKWLTAEEAPQDSTRYPSLADMARRLCDVNARLTADKAMFLATHCSRALEDGGFTWQFDPHNRRSLPTLHSAAEWSACWRGIKRKALWILASDTKAEVRELHPPEGAIWRETNFGPSDYVVVPDTGHNIHHDAPAGIAAIIERFIGPCRHP